jgi:hypothetical protein
MPLVEQELLNLPEKMSSPKVLMGFILLDIQFPVSWGGKSRYFSGQWNFCSVDENKIKKYILCVGGVTIHFYTPVCEDGTFYGIPMSVRPIRR